jgi:hypothetical protein
MARSLLADPEVVQDALRDQRTRATISRVSRSLDEEVVSRSKARDRAERPHLVHGVNLFAAISHLTIARFRLTSALELLRSLTLDDDDMGRVRESVAQVRGPLEWLESYIESPYRTTDEALDALLRDEHEQ